MEEQPDKVTRAAKKQCVSPTQTQPLCAYQQPIPEVTLIQKYLGDVVLANLFRMLRGVTPENHIFIPRCLGDAYMWKPNIIRSEHMDDFDKSFLNHREEWQTKTFLGYHTLGGYHGFFRPDLEEVIHLICDWWKEHPRVKRLYVRTSSYPDEEDCMRGYLDKPRRHAGQTKVWFHTETDLETEPLPFASWEAQKSSLEQIFSEIENSTSA